MDTSGAGKDVRELVRQEYAKIAQQGGSCCGPSRCGNPSVYSVAEAVKELIAIGASVRAHCRPCLTYHVDKAKQIGIDEQKLREAIAVGRQVEKGSMSAMTAFAKSVLDSSTQDNSVCCTGQISPDGTSCCA